MDPLHGQRIHFSPDSRLCTVECLFICKRFFRKIIILAIFARGCESKLDCLKTRIQKFKFLTGSCEVNYMTGLPELQHFLIYMAFYGAI